MSEICKPRGPKRGRPEVTGFASWIRDAYPVINKLRTREVHWTDIRTLLINARIPIKGEMPDAMSIKRQYYKERRRQGDAPPHKPTKRGLATPEQQRDTVISHDSGTRGAGTRLDAQPSGLTMPRRRSTAPSLPKAADVKDAPTTAVDHETRKRPWDLSDDLKYWGDARIGDDGRRMDGNTLRGPPERWDGESVPVGPRGSQKLSSDRD